MDPVATGRGEAGTEVARTCAWCGTPASEAATSCASCGAALAQRESLGNLAIAGLTAVDAALQDYDKRPLQLRGPSPSQGMAPAVIVGAMAGGPIGLAAIGGVAAMAAAEFLGARRPGDAGSLEAIGRPSAAALQALEHLEDGTLPEGGASAAGSATDASLADAGLADAAGAGLADAAEAGLADAAEADGGRSIWRDLPGDSGADSTDDRRHEEDRGDGG